MAITVIGIEHFILASGALGTASMGIAEGLKSTRWTPFGFKELKEELNWSIEALEVSYGDNWNKLLESLYRLGRKKGDLPRILRQGIRIGMTPDTAGKMAEVVGGVSNHDLKAVATKLSEGSELDLKEKNILGRFEVAADARIDSALSLAERSYKNGMVLRASIISFILTIIAVFLIYFDDTSKFDKGYFLSAITVALVAVPLAPVAKDVAKGLQLATKAIRGPK